jgi:hypothetical protein
LRVVARTFARFCWILVFWLTAACLTLGLPARRNQAAALGIPPGAMSLSSAVFVITDLSRPYRGLMAISSGDIRAALARMTARGE